MKFAILNTKEAIVRRFKRRKLPSIRVPSSGARTSITYVVVRYSSAFDHNFALSSCFNDNDNQFIVVDNTGGLKFESHADAVSFGLEQASHDLIVIAHEGVYLPDHWQRMFEQSLRLLETRDPAWGAIGCSGSTPNGVILGHCSFPDRYLNSFRQKESFAEVIEIDHYLVAFRMSSGLRPDLGHPGAHAIGWDFASAARAVNTKCYSVNAPLALHYRNHKGNVVTESSQLLDVENPFSLTFQAESDCSREYLQQRWTISSDSPVTGGAPVDYVRSLQHQINAMPGSVLSALDSAVILLAKGGGGSRLLSLAVADCGVFTGNTLNRSSDCIDMVIPIYKAVMEKFKCKAAWQKQLIPLQLRLAAAKMLAVANDEAHRQWGFKIPECLFLLPELNEAFPKARYVHMLRNPVSTCLRRTHITARLDNQIGRITLPLAYQEAGRPKERIRDDSPAIHMAYTALHQLNVSLDYCRAHYERDRYLEIRFEDLLREPEVTLGVISAWLGCEQTSRQLLTSVDEKRASSARVSYPESVEAMVKEILSPVTTQLGYS